MTIQENLKGAIQELKEKNIEEPVLKARLLLCYILGVGKEYLIIYGDTELEIKKEKEYKETIQRLIKGYPLQYITHHQEFMKLDFYVDKNVLIPRADTEVTVEEVVSYCKEQTNEKARILDLCTGSGAIAISLKKYLPNCDIVGADISKKALEVAKKNAKRNNISNITWIESDLFEHIEGKFDIIVSNPPYIKTDVISTLEKQVRQEPILALDGGEDGIKFYRRIIQQGSNYLKKMGTIFLEIGYDQKQEVLSIIKENKQYKKVKVKKDLAGNDRMIMAKM